VIKLVNTGYKQTLYFADESRYGSAMTVDQPIGLVQSVNPTETNNLIKIRTMGGTRDYSNIVPGKFEVSGTFDYFLQNGPFLRMAMGEDSATTATADSGPRVHTGAELGSACVHTMGSAASPQADSFPSFTLEFADDEDTGAYSTTANLKRIYTGCRVNSLTISGSVDEPVSVSCDWIAQGVKVSTADATSVSDDTEDPYVFYQGQVYVTSGGVDYDTAPSTTSTRVAEVNSFDFTINNNLEPVWYISGTTNIYQSTRGLKNLLVKGRDYDASLGLHFKNKLQYQRFLGSNTATTAQTAIGKYQVVLDFVRAGTIGGTKLTTDRYVRMVLGSCAFNDTNITGSPEDIVNENLGVFVEKAKLHVVDADTSYE
jgi:hypothetical protein